MDDSVHRLKRILVMKNECGKQRTVNCAIRFQEAVPQGTDDHLVALVPWFHQLMSHLIGDYDFCSVLCLQDIENPALPGADSACQSYHSHFFSFSPVRQINALVLFGIKPGISDVRFHLKRN